MRYTLRPGRRLGWEIEQLADELAELFGHTVDLVSLHALHPWRSRRYSPKPGPSMQRDLLLLTEMIDAAELAQHLVAGVTVSEPEADRQRRDALPWDFTVLGEAAGQISGEQGQISRRRLAAATSAAEPDRARLLVD